jgi:protoporphyrinogen oxidase
MDTIGRSALTAGGAGPARPEPGLVVVIGAGPAGLTAAYVLATRYGIRSVVLEADGVVGGLSRTVERDGWRFDLGGHRFFTKVPEVQALWHEILPGDDFMLRSRMSRIYYRGRFFDYPIRLPNALANLGPLEATRCLGSYLWATVHPPADQSSLEGWVAARFGWRLYRHLFQSYSEKVWGVPARELPADFAAQRIKSLSLAKALRTAVRPGRGSREVTSLIDRFHYPKYGPGMMWERCRRLAEDHGSTVLTGARVVAVRHRGGRAVAVVTSHAEGATQEHPCDHVVSSMPISELAAAMEPRPGPSVLDAARKLRYRELVVVALVVPAAAAFPDNWIYVHTPGVKVARIQNFGAWSPYLARDGRTCLGLEYFVSEGDPTWSASDDALVAQAAADLGRIGLCDPSDVAAGFVERVPKAYPLYDTGYEDRVSEVVAWLGRHAANVHPVGRNGMHRYNNQDHSMLTAMLTAERIALGTPHDAWQVNLGDDYHETRETHAASGDRPKKE